MTTVWLLTGPAGAGKTRTSQAWAARGGGVRAVVDVDHLRENVRAGFAAPEYGWNDETQRQWDAAMAIWQAMVTIYQSHGIDCVVDVYAPPWPGSPVDDFLQSVGAGRIILLPPLETCLRRNRERGKQPLLTDDAIRANYAGFFEGVSDEHEGLIIDNSHLSLHETVDQIDRILQLGH